MAQTEHARARGRAPSLATYLEDRAKAGEIRIDNFELAAAVYFDLVRSRMHLRALAAAAFGRPNRKSARPWSAP